MIILILFNSLLILYLIAYIFYIYIFVIANFILKEKIISTCDIINRFAIIVPAHNEELYITRLIKSVEKQDYPANSYTIFVIADNCTDNTVDILLQLSQKVIIRNNNKEIGKGYAIKFAIDNISIENYDAIIIVDADSYFETSVLKNLNNHINSGANVIQCYNGVANPGVTWFTRLMDVARSIGNEIIESGKQKLGLSSHLMGNGMCFHVHIIQKYGWNAFSIGEDWEYYSKLVMNGERIYFSKGSKVLHQESVDIKDATQQRIRWSSGRFSIVAKYGFHILIGGLIEKNLKKVDASFILLFPNPSLGINLSLISLILSFLIFILYKTGAMLSIVTFIILLQLFLFVLGAFKTRNKTANILSILFSPIFLVWKMCIDVISIFGHRGKKWVRGNRQ